MRVRRIREGGLPAAPAVDLEQRHALAERERRRQFRLLQIALEAAHRGRYQRVGIGPGGTRGRDAQIHVAAVGNVHVLVEVAEDGRFPDLMVAGHHPGQVVPEHVGRRLQAEQAEQRRPEVDRRLHQCAAARAGRVRGAWIPEEKRRVAHLFVERHPVLGPGVVLAKQEAVIGPQDQHRVPPQVVGVERIEDVAERGVAFGQQGGVVAPRLGHLLGRLLHRAVAGPVEQRPVVVARVAVAIAAVHGERLVRIEAFHLQEPVVLAVVALQELLRGGEGARLRELAVGAHVLAVDPVGALVARVDVRRPRRLGHLADERVALLAAVELP